MILGLKHVPFGIVKGAKTDAHPKGDARQAWVALMAKYESQEADMEVDLEMMFHQCKMTSGSEDPYLWFQRLLHLRRRLEDMGRTKEDGTVIAVLLAQFPDEYMNVRTAARREARRGNLTLDDLMADARGFYWEEIQD